MIFFLFVAAVLGTFAIRVLLRELFVPVLLLFVIGYAMIWINGPPRHDAALATSTTMQAPPPE